MSELRAWQRETALRQVERHRSHAERTGMPMSDVRIANAVAGYVGTTKDQVLAWMRGAP